MQQTVEIDSEAEDKARSNNKKRLGTNIFGEDIPGTIYAI